MGKISVDYMMASKLKTWKEKLWKTKNFVREFSDVVEFTAYMERMLQGALTSFAPIWPVSQLRGSRTVFDVKN